VALLVLLALALLASPSQASGTLVLMPHIPHTLLLLLLFAVLVLPVNALIFKPIFSALDERDSRIVGARQRADHIHQEATGVLQRYEAAIRGARGEAEAVRKEQIGAARDEQARIAGAARSEAESRVEQARRELDASLEDARQSLRASSQDLARTAAEQILGRTI
jgi:F-type H+-transporting ATPase subunit b